MTSEVETVKVESRRIWTVAQIGAMTFWGGPFAGAFCMSKNYKVFNQLALARKCLKWGLLVTTLLFFGIGLLPIAVIEKIPSAVIPVSYMFIMINFVKRFQKPMIVDHLKTGRRHSHWKVVPYTILFMVLTFAWGYAMILVGHFVKGLF